MFKKYFQGTGRLLFVLFRQHRLKICLWLLGIIGVSLGVALAYPEIYSTPEDIMGFAVTMNNPAMQALIGANYAIGNFNIGSIFASEMLLFTAIAVAVMNILLMKSTSREDEEAGRLEVIQALPTGKIAYLSASTSLMFSVNLTLVILLGSGLALLGTDVFTWESSFLYSSILGTSGLFFTGITAISAQLVESAQGTNILSLGILLFSYALRAVGDVFNETLSLLSPLGWVTRSGVFVDNDGLPVFVLAGGSILLIGVAFYLHARRDMFAGILPNRPGKNSASRLLKTAPGFVWHLEKNKIISWFILIFLLSAAFGAILGELETYFADMAIVEEFLKSSSGTTIVEQFISLLIAIMSIFSVIPAVSIILGLKREEQANRTEHLYARSVSRTKLLSTYFGMSLLVAIMMQMAIASGLYITSAAAMDTTVNYNTYLIATLVYLPAMLIVIGLIILLLGILPRFTLIGWLYIAFLFIELYLGDLLDFPDWLRNLSVFHFIPEYPQESIAWGSMILLVGIGAFITMIGFIGYNKRDIQA